MNKKHLSKEVFPHFFISSSLPATTRLHSGVNLIEQKDFDLLVSGIFSESKIELPLVSKENKKENFYYIANICIEKDFSFFAVFIMSDKSFERKQMSKEISSIIWRNEHDSSSTDEKQILSNLINDLSKLPLLLFAFDPSSFRNLENKTWARSLFANADVPTIERQTDPLSTGQTSWPSTVQYLLRFLLFSLSFCGIYGSFLGSGYIKAANMIVGLILLSLGLISIVSSLIMERLFFSKQKEYFLGIGDDSRSSIDLFLPIILGIVFGFLFGFFFFVNHPVIKNDDVQGLPFSVAILFGTISGLLAFVPVRKTDLLLSKRDRPFKSEEKTKIRKNKAIE